MSWGGGGASPSGRRLPRKTRHVLVPDDTPETCIYSNWSPWSACSSSTCDKGKRMRQRMLKAQLDLSVPCPDTQDFQPCMGPGCSEEGEGAARGRQGLAEAGEGGAACLCRPLVPARRCPCEGTGTLTVVADGAH